MKLPSEVKGNNRIRDAKIISLYVDEGLSQTEIANKFKLAQPRISTILRNNAITIISTRKDYEKVKRLHSMKKMLSNPKIPDANSKLEVIREMRKEIEGDGKANVSNTINSISIGGLDPETMRAVIAALRERALSGRTA